MRRLLFPCSWAAGVGLAEDGVGGAEPPRDSRRLRSHRRRRVKSHSCCFSAPCRGRGMRRGMSESLTTSKPSGVPKGLCGLFQSLEIRAC